MESAPGVDVFPAVSACRALVDQIACRLSGTGATASPRAGSQPSQPQTCGREHPTGGNRRACDWPSHSHDLDLNTTHRSEVFKIAHVGCVNHVAIDAERNEGGINNVGGRCAAHQFTSGPPQPLIKSDDIEARQCPGQPGLPGTTAPDLADDTAVGHRWSAITPGGHCPRRHISGSPRSSAISAPASNTSLMRRAPLWRVEPARRLHGRARSGRTPLLR